MDAVDLEILARLTWKPYDPQDAARGILGPWDVARALGLHGNTVKRRLARMREAGVVHGIHLMPEPGLLGMRSGLYAFRWSDAEAKARGLAALLDRPATLERPGAIDSWSFVGEEAWVGLFAREAGLEALATEAQHAAGALDVRLVEHRTWPVDRSQVSDLDVRLLAAFHADALRAISEVASEVGVTPRTVRTRLARLAGLGAFVIVPYWDVGRMDGLVPFVLQAELDDSSDPAPRRRFLSAFPEAYDRSSFDAARPYVLLASPNTAGLERAVRRAQGVPGVALARALLVEATTPCPLPTDVTPLELVVTTAEHRA